MAQVQFFNRIQNIQLLMLLLTCVSESPVAVYGISSWQPVLSTLEGVRVQPAYGGRNKMIILSSLKGVRLQQSDFRDKRNRKDTQESGRSGIIKLPPVTSGGESMPLLSSVKQDARVRRETFLNKYEDLLRPHSEKRLYRSASFNPITGQESPDPITQQAPSKKRTQSEPIIGQAPSNPVIKTAPSNYNEGQAPSDPMIGNAPSISTVNKPSNPIRGQAPSNPTEEEAPSNPTEEEAPSNLMIGNEPSNPIKGQAPSYSTEGQAPSNPIKGKEPSNPIKGKEPSNPIKGQAPSNLMIENPSSKLTGGKAQSNPIKEKALSNPMIGNASSNPIVNNNITDKLLKVLRTENASSEGVSTGIKAQNLQTMIGKEIKLELDVLGALDDLKNKNDEVKKRLEGSDQVIDAWKMYLKTKVGPCLAYALNKMSSTEEYQLRWDLNLQMFGNTPMGVLLQKNTELASDVLVMIFTSSRFEGLKDDFEDCFSGGLWHAYIQLTDDYSTATKVALLHKQFNNLTYEEQLATIVEVMKNMTEADKFIEASWISGPAKEGKDKMNMSLGIAIGAFIGAVLIGACLRDALDALYYHGWKGLADRCTERFCCPCNLYKRMQQQNKAKEESPVKDPRPESQNLIEGNQGHLSQVQASRANLQPCQKLGKLLWSPCHRLGTPRPPAAIISNNGQLASPFNSYRGQSPSHGQLYTQSQAAMTMSPSQRRMVMNLSPSVDLTMPNVPNAACLEEQHDINATGFRENASIIASKGQLASPFGQLNSQSQPAMTMSPSQRRMLMNLNPSLSLSGSPHQMIPMRTLSGNMIPMQHASILQHASGINTSPMQHASGINASPMQRASGINTSPMQHASGINTSPMQHASGINASPMQHASESNTTPMQHASERNSTLMQHAPDSSMAGYAMAGASSFYATAMPSKVQAFLAAEADTPVNSPQLLTSPASQQDQRQYPTQSDD